MYISLKWLQNVLGLNKLKISEFSEKLNLGGFEIEEIIQKQRFEEKDYIFNVSEDSISFQNRFYIMNSENSSAFSEERSNIVDIAGYMINFRLVFSGVDSIFQKAKKLN